MEPGTVSHRKERMLIEATSSIGIRAAPEAVYGIIADYRSGHPRILPPQYFGPLVVEQGGVGAGTRIRFTMTVAGRSREAVADVEEPKPGKVLIERGVSDNFVTTFTVQPEGPGCFVTIRTSWERGGLQGLIERFTAPRLRMRIFPAELQLLKQVAEAEAVART